MVKIGIIGGTGFSEKKPSEMASLKTDYGNVNYDTIEMGGKEVLFIPRHADLEVPHIVNYRGNILAMKDRGVDTILSVSACGRLGKVALPGKLGIVTDVDWDDLGDRPTTFAQKGLVLHASMNPPFSEPLQDYMRQAWKENRADLMDIYSDAPDLSFGLLEQGTYFNINGPHFLPPAKEARLRKTVHDAQYIGQTLVPEGHLARELGMAYAAVAMIVDHSSFPDAPSTVHHADGVMHAVKYTAKMASSLLEKTVELIPEEFYDAVCHDAFTHSLHSSQVNLDQLKRDEKHMLYGILKKELDSRKESEH